MNKRSEIQLKAERDEYTKRGRTVASHPSFGLMTVSTVSSNQKVFASSRAAYDKYIAMSFQTCNLSIDRFDSTAVDQRTFSKFTMAPHDFVRFLSSVYTGDFINIELTHQLDTDNVIEVDAIDAEIDFESALKQSLEHSWDDAMHQINEYLEMIENHINDVVKLPAAELRKAKNSLYHAVNNMSENADYSLTVWDEYFDKLENAVLLEVDGLLVNSSINNAVTDLNATGTYFTAIEQKD